MALPLPLLATLALLAPTARAADYLPPGSTVETAAVIDVTAAGLASVETLLPALLPSSIAIPDQSDSGNAVCDYAYGLYGAWVKLAVANADVVPSPGLLAVTVDFNVSLNSTSDPFDLYYELDCWLFSFDDTCSGRVETFPAQAYMALYLDVVDDGGTPRLDVTVADLQVNYELDSDKIVLDGCSIGDLEEVLSYVGLSVYDLVLDYAGSYIESTVADMGAEIETTLEDAFNQAVIDQQFTLLDKTLTVHLQPADVVIDTPGIRILMEGSMEADAPDSCIDAWDPGGSLVTASEPPDLGSVPSGVTAGYHAGAFVSDELANQAMYALWRSGLLCYTLEGEVQGFELSTSLFDLMGTDVSEAFAEIFPESVPLTIITRPRQAPLADFEGANDVGLTVSDLGVDMYGEVDARQALVLGLDVNATAGANLTLDGSTGTLDIGIDLDPADIVATVRSNELAADATSAIESGFGGLLQTILSMFAGSLLEGTSVDIPSFNGVGLTDIEVAAAGTGKDWLGLFAWLGPVSYPSTGCDDTGSGCEGGCGTNGVATARWSLLGLAGAALLARRRRSPRR